MVLLDTHAFLWWCENSSELSPAARRAMGVQDCLVSHATFWEIAIKLSLKKLTLPDAFDRYMTAQISANGFDSLPIDVRHITRTVSLPWHHRDPFDRMLAAQALEERVSFVSGDPAFDAYGVTRIW